MPDGIGGLVEQHPWAIGLAIGGVALIAYMQSRDNPPAEQSVTFAGGGKARAIDPEASAITQAAIAAGVSNVGTIASLLGLEDTNATALRGSLAQTAADRDVSLAQTAAGRDVSLAQAEGERQASLARTAAEREVSLHSSDVAFQSTQATLAEQLEAARITAGSQAAQTAANLEAQRADAKNREFAIQAQKDIARAQANASIVGGVLNGIASFFGF